MNIFANLQNNCIYFVNKCGYLWCSVSVFFFLPNENLAVGIQADENEYKDTKGQQGGTTIADEWQGDTNNRG